MSESGSGHDPAVDEALLTSRLGALPAEVSELVLAGAHDITVPPGGIVIRDGDGPVVLLVVRGLLRTYLATAAGRGSVREVVVRILGELWEEGLIKTPRDEIVIVDAARPAASAPRGMRGYWKPGCLAGLPDDLIDTVVAPAAAAPSPLSAIHLHQVGGAVRGFDSRTLPFGQRDAASP